MKEKVCAFTGHRPQNLPFGFNESDERCQTLKKLLRYAIEKLITEKGVTLFVSGMALGVDIYAAEIVLEMKKKYPNVKLEAAIPCETQAVKWREKDRDRYFRLVEQCDTETLLQTKYTADCMQKRNEYMANKADYLIAVWDGKPSGTGKTVKYAESIGKTVIRISPSEL